LPIPSNGPITSNFGSGRILRPSALSSTNSRRGRGELTVVDINLKNWSKLPRLMRWLTRRPTNGQVIFGVDQRSYFESTQAYAAGATGLVPRPLDGQRLATMLAAGRGLTGKNCNESLDGPEDGLVVSVTGLENMFAAVMRGETLNLNVLNATASVIVERIEEDGLNRWLDGLRQHHSQTYQHCLIVTAVAVAFGRHLGFSKIDKQRLATAGLLHDIGKAKIPLHILEKPTQLSEEETAVMRTHPELGYAALCQEPGMHTEMLDMVLHHHEYLDGSGYPHGLSGSEISDLVRTITIADVFGALVEYRPTNRHRRARMPINI
jgi:putative nucleotidyltransferase with HDIG domain